VFTLFYLLVLEQILQGFYSLWQGLEWLKMARRRLSAGTGLYAPRVALVCPIKGVEEDLESNLLALTHFDYPQYEIFFAIATAEDPAYRVLERVAAASKRRVHIIRAGRALDCSDKVHNLTAAVEQVDEQFDVLVFTDSDGRPPRRWLTRLVAPLADANVGAATTFRWLFPRRGGFWSALAAAWSASAATYLGEHKRNFCWGGGTAIKHQRFDQLRVLNSWRGTASDDYVLTHALQNNGLRIVFAPECLVPSPCAFDLRTFFEFTNRQLVITRIYAPRLWGTALIGHLFYCATILVGIASLALSTLNGLPSLQFLVLVSIPPIFAAVRGILRLVAVLELLPELREQLLKVGWVWVLLAPLVPFVYVYNSLAAVFTRKITWRGIRYELVSPFRTRIIAR
jgi:cellulose synthase/poly-beta-1,6-N-acetylglucosamine synthase-like glycosyltransferase